MELGALARAGADGSRRRARDRGLLGRARRERRNLPWLDLARDPAQRDELRALIKEFATTGYRPAALERPGERGRPPRHAGRRSIASSTPTTTCS